MQRIFVEPEYTQTANEAALLTTDAAGLDAQSEDGNWTWTPGDSKYTISTEIFPISWTTGVLNIKANLSWLQLRLHCKPKTAGDRNL